MEFGLSKWVRAVKVLWVSHSAGGGGAELCLAEGALALRALGVDVTVVLPREGPLEERLRSAGVETVQSPSSWWVHFTDVPYGLARRAAKPAVHLRNALHLHHLIERRQPDVVVTNTFATPDAALAARMAGVPHAWYLHEYGDPIHQLAFTYGRRLSLRAIRALSARVLANSAALAQHLRPDLGHTPVDVVHQAVDLPEASEPVGAVEGAMDRYAEHRASLEMVMVGTRQPGKRQEDAVRALAILRARGVDAALTLIGQGQPAYDEWLHNLTTQSGLADHVRFVDYADDPHAYVSGADVALMCSVNEAFGRVTVEAMKLGVPVVGAASGGTLDLVRDGVTGLLYRPGDSEDLADKLAALAGDVELRSRMSGAARDDARKRFTLDRFGHDLRAAFERTITP